MSEKESKREEKDFLNILFPGKEIELAKGEVVIMRPLSLENLTKVIDAFNKVATEYSKNKEPASILLNALKEMLLLLTYCVDRPMSDIPGKFTPDLIDVFIEQNLDDVTLGKWTALIQRLSSELKGVEGLAGKVMKNQGLVSTLPKG